MKSDRVRKNDIDFNSKEPNVCVSIFHPLSNLTFLQMSVISDKDSQMCSFSNFQPSSRTFASFCWRPHIHFCYKGLTRPFSEPCQGHINLIPRPQGHSSNANGPGHYEWRLNLFYRLDPGSQGQRIGLWSLVALQGQQNQVRERERVGENEASAMESLTTFWPRSRPKPSKVCTEF